jgi:hypothetical protein
MEAPKIYNLESFPGHLKTLTKQDWQPLLDLIPEIESTKEFELSKGIKEIEKGVFEMPHSVPASCVWKFHDIFLRLSLQINFDWSSWDAGREIAQGGVNEIMKQDLVTICMLLTAIIRNDRFCEGTLTSFFNEGSGLTALKRIDEIVNGQ